MFLNYLLQKTESKKFLYSKYNSRKKPFFLNFFLKYFGLEACEG